MSGIQFEDNGTDDFSLDMSSVQAQAGFEVIPKGTYPFVISAAEGKRSQSSNNPMISLTLEIDGGEYAGRKLFTHVVFSPKAVGRAKQTMQTLGLEELANSPNLKPLDPATAEQFVGKRGKAVVTIEKYEGNDQNRVKRLIGEGSGDGFGG